MKLLVFAIAVAAAAPRGEAAEGKPPLMLKPKAAIVTPVANARYAPFATPSGAPELDLFPKNDPREAASRSSCNGERSLCYDPGSGRIVYKPARHLMPDLPGLQAENISVKRGRIVFRYSF
jgi:hypothetical protein